MLPTIEKVTYFQKWVKCAKSYALSITPKKWWGQPNLNRASNTT
jgi:hypothetical protein